MSEEPYTNLDLDTADEILVRAGQGEIAKALRFQTQGNRNLVQGVWGQSFVHTLESVMDTRVVNVLANVQKQLDEQHDMVQQLLNMQQASEKNARKALSVARQTTRGLKKLSGEVSALGTAMAESKEDRADLRERDIRLEARIIQLESRIEQLAQERGDAVE